MSEALSRWHLLGLAPQDHQPTADRAQLRVKVLQALQEEAELVHADAPGLDEVRIEDEDRHLPRDARRRKTDSYFFSC